MVSASPGLLSGRYRSTRANLSVTPPGYLLLAWTPSKAISTTSSGLTRTTPRCGPPAAACSGTASSSSRAVCQLSRASVSPLNVLPSMTMSPVAGSRAPRCRLDSQPWRRPWPHSAASTTRSRVCLGLTLIQSLPRRPAPYGASTALTTTPSCPRCTASAKNVRSLLRVRRQQSRNHQVRGQRWRAARSGRWPGCRSGRCRPGAEVEQEHSERDLARFGWPACTCLAGGARRGHLKRVGPAVGPQRDGLPVQHGSRDVQRPGWPP